MKIKVALLVAVIMTVTAAAGASAESSMTNSINISDTFAGGDVNITVYSEAEFDNIINYILMPGNYIGGNLNIINIAAGEETARDCEIIEDDFRGAFAPKLF